MTRDEAETILGFVFQEFRTDPLECEWVTGSERYYAPLKDTKEILLLVYKKEKSSLSLSVYEGKFRSMFCLPLLQDALFQFELRGNIKGISDYFDHGLFYKTHSHKNIIDKMIFRLLEYVLTVPNIPLYLS